MRSIPGKSIVERVYSETIEEYLPRKVSEVNGVLTRKHRLLRMSGDPEYERESVDALKAHCREDDSILVLGGGWGVTAVWAARLGAEVTVFEAAAERVGTVREAIALNGVEDDVTVHHAIVGESRRVLGDDSAAAVVDPADLPECDVIEMDVEGAELAVLERLAIRPRVVIVETHANRGSPASAVEERLTGMGYEVVGTARQDEDHAVLTAVVA